MPEISSIVIDSPILSPGLNFIINRFYKSITPSNTTDDCGKICLKWKDE